MAIPARLSLATLGVADVARSTAFYERLGWTRSSASVPGEVSFFRTRGGLLSIFGVAALAADAGLSPPAPGGGFRGVALAINLDDRADVDAAFEMVLAAGGVVVKPPRETSWGGYSGYFADPDGHLWEVAHNPGFPIDENGIPTLP